MQNKTDTSPATAAATRATNEWGIPDWRDPAAYGNFKRWTFDRWRWEFRRRRTDLRQYFDQGVITRNSSPQIHSLNNIDPAQAGFLLQTDTNAARHFGYVHGLPNPRISEQPDWAIRTYGSFEIDPAIKSWESKPLGQLLDLSKLEAPIGTLLHAAWESGLTSSESRDLLASGHGELSQSILSTRLLDHLLNCKLVFLRRSQMSLTFNLEAPLAEQLDAAARKLKQRQIEVHGHKLQKRTHPRKWLDYLRILDARAAAPEASWRQFTEDLYSERLVERQKNPAGGYRAPEPTAGRTRLKAAQALQFNF